MSQNKQIYCCSNPECHKTFALDEASFSSEFMQQTEVGVNAVLQHGTPLVHVQCPECATIVTSIYVPAEILQINLRA